MAIYAMDPGLIESAAKAYAQTSTNMDTIVSNGSKERTNNLGEWAGKTAEKYDDSTTQKEQVIKQDADVGKGMGEYLLEYKHAIESNEEFLSQLRI